MTASTLFSAIFAADGESRTAVLYEHREIAYDELRAETIRTAEALHALGLEQGDRIAILLNDSPEFIASFVAIQSLGAIAVPINMGLRTDEQEKILSDCTARAAIVEADLCNTLLTGASERLRHLKDVLVVGRDRSSCVGEIAGVNTRLLADAPRGTLSVDFPVKASADTPAFILYTSGSTGDPKGAVHRQADVFHTDETFCKEVLRLTPGDRLFSSSRLPFAYGLGNSFSFTLLNGMTSILCREKPTPEVIGRILREYQPTIFFGVPVVYNLLLDHHRRVNAVDCSSLRLCISAGEALPAHLGEEWQRTFGVEVLDGIGSTEMLHMWMSNHAGEVRYGSSGKVLKGYEAKLLDEHGNPTPAGTEGNLWVKGASAAMGYWERPEATARTFVDGWVRTGDLYRRDADGYWFHMGRGDDCFKSSGQWVSPVEVEGVLLRQQGVGRVAVVEDFDDDGLPCACAFVLREDLESDCSKLEDELRQLAKTALPRFKRPRKYMFVTELPYTATGKVQRFKLREQLRAKRGVASSNRS
jgi:benzoate-CoA ligase family protein